MSKALARVAGSTDVAIRPDIIEQAREYAAQSRSERTQHEYERCWRQFAQWCDREGLEPYPASPATLVAYVTDLAKNGGPKKKPLSVSSIQQSLSALQLRHSMGGAGVQAFKTQVLKEVLKGIRRQIGQTRTPRRVRPLMDAQLSDLLDLLRPDTLRDARDAAILAVGFGAARRRSELVCLDFEQLGSGRGILTIDERGVTVRLMTSKTNQDGSGDEVYILPRMVVPRLCAAVENYIQVGGVRRGEPVFRGVSRSGQSRNRHSGFEGVTWHDAHEKWQASAKVGKGRKYLGLHDDPAAAAAAISAFTGNPVPAASSGALHKTRMSARTVARVVKARIGHLLRSQYGRKKVTPEAMAQAMAEYSGHSMRVGHITSAADRNVPTHHIKATSGHKSDAMIALYSRVADKTKNSSLKGSGL